MTEENTGRVTNANLADKLDTVSDTVIETKALVVRALSDITDHEVRIRAMEKLIWKGLGVVAGVSALFSVAITVIGVVIAK